MCLLALTASVKPLANIMANYIRYDRHKDFGENFQCRHLLSVARLEKGSTGILSKFSTKINMIASGTGAGLTPCFFLFAAVTQIVTQAVSQAAGCGENARMQPTADPALIDPSSGPEPLAGKTRKFSIFAISRVVTRRGGQHV